MKTLADQSCKDGAGAASPVGEGAVALTGAGIHAAVKSYDALVDVSIEGDSVQIATINWKGTAAPAVS